MLEKKVDEISIDGTATFREIADECDKRAILTVGSNFNPFS